MPPREQVIGSIAIAGSTTGRILREDVSEVQEPYHLVHRSVGLGHGVHS